MGIQTYVSNDGTRSIQFISDLLNSSIDSSITCNSNKHLVLESDNTNVNGLLSVFNKNHSSFYPSVYPFDLSFSKGIEIIGSTSQPISSLNIIDFLHNKQFGTCPFFNFSLI